MLVLDHDYRVKVLELDIHQVPLGLLHYSGAEGLLSKLRTLWAADVELGVRKSLQINI